MHTIDERSQQFTQEYLQQIVETFQEDLVAVILYGSAASPRFEPGKSNVNLMVVAKTIKMPDLKKISVATRKFKLTGLEPIYLTLSEFQLFGDGFPLEAADMMENYQIVYGEDLVKNIRVSDQDVLAQIQRELVAKTIRCRFLYDEFNSDNKQLVSFIQDFVTPYRVLMRALLKIIDKGYPAPYEYLEIIAQLEERHGMRLDAFREAFLAKEGKVQLTGGATHELFAKIVIESEALHQYALAAGVR